MGNAQGHNLQHYIDVVENITEQFKGDVLTDVAKRCFELNLCTSECYDRVKQFISLEL